MCRSPPSDRPRRTRSPTCSPASPIERICSSPLQRAAETAVPIAVAVKANVLIDDRLIDRDYGPWAAERRVDLEERFGSPDRAPDVEPADDVLARAVWAVTDIAARHQGHRAMVVTHDAINRLLIASISRLPGPDELVQPTGGWNVVREATARGVFLSSVHDRATVTVRQTTVLGSILRAMEPAPNRPHG
jgi:broad specificity phosphatase PhoE